MAKYIGTSIIDKPDSEIQKIAYKSWQEETPNNSDNLNKQGQKYVKFMSDDWIDTINKDKRVAMLRRMIQLMLR